MEFINYNSFNKVEDIKRLKFIAENLPSTVNRALSILDIGCGNGNINYQLARNGYIVTGIDISQTTIKRAIERFFKNLMKNKGVAIVTVPNSYGPRELLSTRPVGRIQDSNGMSAKLIKKTKNSLGYRGYNKQTSAEYLDHIQFFTMKKLTKLAYNGGFNITKKRSGNFVENVFPFSLLTRRAVVLQKIDCLLADILPLACTSAFYSVWKLKNN